VKVDKTPAYFSLPADQPIKEQSIVFAMSVRGKKVENGTYEFDYMRVPDTRTRWEIFRDGIYNSEEGTYCGHPPKKWGNSEYFVYLDILIVLRTIED